MWCKVALSGQSSAKLHKIIFLMVVFVFYCFFNKDLVIYISQWLFVSSRLFLVVVFCGIIYSYKNRTQCNVSMYLSYDRIVLYL